MNHLLEIVNNKPIEGFTEKLAFGGQMVLIGMSVIFAVLSLLWLCLYVFKVFFHDIPAKKKAAKVSKTVVEIAPVKQVAVEQNDDDEIVAVIAAAIAAAESENAGLKFRVVSFRRK